MLDYSQIKERVYIEWNNEPYEVLSSHVFRKQQRKPVNQTKLKNLITGKIIEQTFHPSDKVEKAELNTKKINYIFHKYNRQTDSEEYWFTDAADPKDRFTLQADIIGNQLSFMKENDSIDALFYNDMVIGITLPIKMEFTVSEAPPTIKGNTATGGTKPVTLETGAVVNVPLFIKAGEHIIVNTQTGEYAERVGKNF